MALPWWPPRCALWRSSVTTAAAEVRTLIAESAERVDDGLRQADGMNSTMGKLLDSVDRVRVLVAEITSAASLQREGIVRSMNRCAPSTPPPRKTLRWWKKWPPPPKA